MKKKPVLVAHDCGQGAVWAIVNARSRSEIRKKYPALKVYRRKPLFMKRATYEMIAQKINFDIDDEPSGWLAELVRGSSKA